MFIDGSIHTCRLRSQNDFENSHLMLFGHNSKSMALYLRYTKHHIKTATFNKTGCSIRKFIARADSCLLNKLKVSIQSHLPVAPCSPLEPVAPVGPLGPADPVEPV